MSTPIVIVSSGGLPITEASNGQGMPVSVAANGYGIPCTVVSSGGIPVVGSGAGTTTFDPVNISAGMVLSNGNLTATGPAAGAGHNARSITSHNSGQFYFSAVLTSGDGGVAIGIGNASALSSNYIGIDLNSVAYFPSGGVVINNATVATIATYSNGNTLDAAVDYTAHKIWFRVNGGGWNNDIIANQNPATGAGGVSLATLNAGPYFAQVTGGNASSNTSFTANFGATAYTNPAPSGYGNY